MQPQAPEHLGVVVHLNARKLVEHAERLERDPYDVVLGLRLGKPEAVYLDAIAEPKIIADFIASKEMSPC